MKNGQIDEGDATIGVVKHSSSKSKFFISGIEPVIN